MITPPRLSEPHGGVSGFRWKLLVAVGLVVSSVTVLEVFLVERNASANARSEFQHEFQSALASLHHVQELRYAEIAARCDALVHNPRVHASLEDDSLDLLYDNAHDQLHDLIDGRGGASVPAADPRHATHYRFLDARGAIIPPSGSGRVGELPPGELAQLAVSALPDKQENGYFFRTASGERGAINQVVVAPILQNLLENARKYNRDGGRIAITAGEDGPGSMLLVIGNTGQSIASADGEHIFERFHRGVMGENVPGHGLGLNLARDLARLHGGDLRLVRSQEDWTEFEVCFRLASCETPPDDGIHP